MNKITKCPVKYAILKVAEKNPKTGKEYTIGLMVERCYLLDTHETYYPNGDVDTRYRVNFPYNDIARYQQTMFSLRPDIGKISFDREYQVDSVFDTYEEAKEKLEADKKRIRKVCLVRSALKGANKEGLYEKTIAALNKADAICKSYEIAVLEATKDMIFDEKGIQKVKK